MPSAIVLVLVKLVPVNNIVLIRELRSFVLGVRYNALHRNYHRRVIAIMSVTVRCNRPQALVYIVLGNICGVEDGGVRV